MSMVEFKRDSGKIIYIERSRIIAVYKDDPDGTCVTIACDRESENWHLDNEVEEVLKILETHDAAKDT